MRYKYLNIRLNAAVSIAIKKQSDLGRILKSNNSNIYNGYACSNYVKENVLHIRGNLYSS